MSLQISNPVDDGGEPLKIWNCVSCRRRKLRCDRHHPCAPCTRNKLECVFPTSGRLPRRSRVGDHTVRKQVELVGRLRRLEAMVGGLSSQVENAAGISPSEHDIDSSASQPTAANSEQSSLCINEDPEPLQVAQDLGVLEVTNNGDLVVGRGFWTVFCKEVSINIDSIALLESSFESGFVKPSFLQRLTSEPRWRIYLKLSKAIQLYNSATAAAHQCRIVRLITAFTISCSEVLLLHAGIMTTILFLPRCSSSGNYIPTTSIHSSKSCIDQP